MLPNFQSYESSEGSKNYFCHQCQTKFVKSLAPEAEFPQSIECTKPPFFILNFGKVLFVKATFVRRPTSPFIHQKDNDQFCLFLWEIQFP